MRRRGSREVNIFNLSMLDVICGALGAVLIIMVALSQRPEQAKECPECPPRRECPPQKECPPEGVSRKEYDELKKEVNQLRGRLPFVVGISWLHQVNIDLYVEDSTGKMEPPTLQKRQWPYWPGEVAIDRSKTPGYEVWMVRDAGLGEFKYRVIIKLMDTQVGPGASIPVYAYVMFREQLIALGYVRLTAQNRMIHAATLGITPQGKLTVAPQLGLEAEAGLEKYRP
ncbi:MAG: hypothetical protein FJW20_13535 [Acidimicrobiia bacterium]|nr:hypothetical protein [Acidimicrobiia bacterium]